MSVTTKCGGCNMTCGHSSHDCPCGKPMHAWCGVAADPNIPEGHGAKRLCNNCSNAAQYQTPINNSSTFISHGAHIRHQESQDLTAGFESSLSHTSQSRYHLHYHEGYYGNFRGNTESEVPSSILPPTRRSANYGSDDDNSEICSILNCDYLKKRNSDTSAHSSSQASSKKQKHGTSIGTTPLQSSHASSRPCSHLSNRPESHLSGITTQQDESSKRSSTGSSTTMGSAPTECSSVNGGDDEELLSDNISFAEEMYPFSEDSFNEAIQDKALEFIFDKSGKEKPIYKSQKKIRSISLQLAKSLGENKDWHSVPKNRGNAADQIQRKINFLRKLNGDTYVLSRKSLMTTLMHLWKLEKISDDEANFNKVIRAFLTLTHEDNRDLTRKLLAKVKTRDDLDVSDDTTDNMVKELWCQYSDPTFAVVTPNFINQLDDNAKFQMESGRSARSIQNSSHEKAQSKKKFHDDVISAVNGLGKTLQTVHLRSQVEILRDIAELTTQLNTASSVNNEYQQFLIESLAALKQELHERNAAFSKNRS